MQCNVMREGRESKGGDYGRKEGKERAWERRADAGGRGHERRKRGSPSNQERNYGGVRGPPLIKSIDGYGDSGEA